MESIERPGFSGWGTYHYVGADTVTWYGFATMIFAESARLGRKSSASPPDRDRRLSDGRPRPAYSVLDMAKLEHTSGIKPRPLRNSLIATLERLLGQGKAA